LKCQKRDVRNVFQKRLTIPWKSELRIVP
jgi:hypothetical protein